MAWLICGILSAINAVLSLWLGETLNFWFWSMASPLQFLIFRFANHNSIRVTLTDLIGGFLVGVGGMAVYQNLVKVFGG